eukprot:SAG11_NODE_1782_length_4261_cov_2.796732_4_plen_230_part_00
MRAVLLAGAHFSTSSMSACAIGSSEHILSDIVTLRPRFTPGSSRTGSGCRRVSALDIGRADAAAEIKSAEYQQRGDVRTTPASRRRHRMDHTSQVRSPLLAHSAQATYARPAHGPASAQIADGDAVRHKVRHKVAHKVVDLHAEAAESLNQRDLALDVEIATLHRCTVATGRGNACAQTSMCGTRAHAHLALEFRVLLHVEHNVYIPSHCPVHGAPIRIFPPRHSFPSI